MLLDGRRNYEQTLFHLSLPLCLLSFQVSSKEERIINKEIEKLLGEFVSSKDVCLCVRICVCVGMKCVCLSAWIRSLSAGDEEGIHRKGIYVA